MYARNRRIVAILIVCLMLLCMIMLCRGCDVVYAATNVDVPQVEENTFVYDEEELLSKEQKTELNNLLRYLEEKTKIEFVVVTTYSFKGMSIEDYANDLFNTLGLGKSEFDNGILFLVSESEGHARLEIGAGIDDVLTDSRCGYLLDQYYVPDRDNGKNAEAVSNTVKGVLAVLGNKYGVQIVENQEEIIREVEKKDTRDFWIQVIVLIFIAIILVSMDVYQGGSRGGYYGGGFGSSGGGSHFGGGRSMGGGASR